MIPNLIYFIVTWQSIDRTPGLSEADNLKSDAKFD